MDMPLWGETGFKQKRRDTLSSPEPSSFADAADPATELATLP